MLAARFVLRDWVQEQFRAQLQRHQRGVEKEGAFYLFTLRLSRQCLTSSSTWRWG